MGERGGGERCWRRRLSDRLGRAAIPLGRAMSNLKDASSNISARRLRDERERRRRADEESRDEAYNRKLRLLNLDRVQLERDRRDLYDAQRELELERRRLVSEGVGVNVLAWYDYTVRGRRRPCRSRGCRRRSGGVEGRGDQAKVGKWSSEARRRGRVGISGGVKTSMNECSLERVSCCVYCKYFVNIEYVPEIQSATFIFWG